MMVMIPYSNVLKIKKANADDLEAPEGMVMELRGTGDCFLWLPRGIIIYIQIKSSSSYCFCFSECSLPLINLMAVS